MAGLLDDQQRYRDALAQYLVSEKDQRPYWETDHRGMVMPLVKSGYNNSVSYGVPGIAGGSAWGVLNDIISGRQVAKGEIEQGASDAAGAAMTGSLAASSVRPKANAPASDPQSFPFYRGSSADRNIGQPARGVGTLNSGALFGTTSPEVASSYAMAHAGLPEARPRVFAGEARFNNPQVIDAEGADIFSIPSGNGTTSIWDAVKAARKSGNDGLVVNNLVDNPQFSEGPSSTVVAAIQRGTVFDRNGNLVFANAPTSAAAPSLQHIAKTVAQDAPGIRAYHGSPHDFDKFDLSKIGTGEGAQAFGHGLYFAESEGVAKTYRDALGNYDDAVKWKGAEPPTPEQQRIIDQMSGFDVGRNRQPDLNSVRTDITRAINQERMSEGMPGWDAERSARRVADLRKQLETLDGMKDMVEVQPPGRLYEVNIKADPEHFLDWDKPLSQQGALNDKMKAAFEALRGKPFDKWHGEYDIGTGSSYPDLAYKWAGGDINKATSALREAGIPGIKYLDQGSRGAGEGSRNYVVFDDNLVEILRKYGLAGLFAGMGAMGSTPQGNALYGEGR